MLLAKQGTLFSGKASDSRSFWTACISSKTPPRCHKKSACFPICFTFTPRDSLCSLTPSSPFCWPMDQSGLVVSLWPSLQFLQTRWNSTPLLSRHVPPIILLFQQRTPASPFSPVHSYWSWRMLKGVVSYLLLYHDSPIEKENSAACAPESRHRYLAALTWHHSIPYLCQQHWLPHWSLNIPDTS